MSVAENTSRRPLWLSDQDRNVLFSDLFLERRFHDDDDDDNEFRRRTRSAASLYAYRRNRSIRQRQGCTSKKSHLHLNSSHPIPIPGRETCLTPDELRSSNYDLAETELPRW